MKTKKKETFYVKETPASEEVDLSKLKPYTKAESQRILSRAKVKPKRKAA